MKKDPSSATRSTSVLHLWTLIEVFAFCAYVALYIWKLQASYRPSWIVFPVWLIASFLIHKDTTKTVGWRADNLGSATRRATAVLLPLMAALFAVGFILGALNDPPNHILTPRHFFGYTAFCFIQQVGLSSYMTNRLLAVWDDRVRVALFAGTIFAALHWPNPALVPLTWIGGSIMSWLFARERNIVPLAIGQGVLGTLVWWALPNAWHHAMRVGPGFYHFHPR